jgi:2-oxoglutarate dehydrogenase E1 component
VCVPTTPAQIFHLLRRQLLQPARKPLIIMSPKSLLRHPLAVSDLSELADNQFLCVLPETDKLHANTVEKIIFTSGKVYYDLIDERRARKLENVAIIRIEQLYPFPEKACRAIMAAYPRAKEIVWCQEEPENQGAWRYIQEYLNCLLSKGQDLSYIGRKMAASPAAGYHAVHEQEQNALVGAALWGVEIAMASA